MKRIGYGLALAGLGFLAVGARPAAAARCPEGRVSAIQGNLLVKGPDDEDWSYLERNAVINDDDIVWADEDSLAEVEMEDGAWLRLGPDTRVDIRRLPPAGEVALKRGSIYVDLSDGADEGVIVRTPAGDVTVEPGSLARVDLARNDSVRVMVRRGRVSGELAHGMERRAAAGDELMLRPEDRTVRLAALDRGEFDAFDDWADDRVAFYLDRQLPPGVDRYIPGVCELADYGDWVDYDGARCWRPRRVADDWRPYSVGYWGYCHGDPLWVSGEPWGYTTCHYGRWMWADRQGWLWRPAYVWGPGYVRWAYCGDQVMWVPLDPYDRPCYRYPPRLLAGMQVDPRVWSCMPRDNFARRDCTRIVVVERAPLIRVTEIRPVRDVTVIYHDLPPTCRYRCVRTTERTTVVATDRMTVLERRPARTDFRVATIRPVATTGSTARDNEPRFAPRDDVRARVSRQLTVPPVRVNHVAGTTGPSVGQPAAVDRVRREDNDVRGPAARTGDAGVVRAGDPRAGGRADDSRTPVDRMLNRTDYRYGRDGRDQDRDHDGNLIPPSGRRILRGDDGDNRSPTPRPDPSIGSTSPQPGTGPRGDNPVPGQGVHPATDNREPRTGQPVDAARDRGSANTAATGRTPANAGDNSGSRPGTVRAGNGTLTPDHAAGNQASGASPRNAQDRDNGRSDRNSRADKNRRDRNRDRNHDGDDNPSTHPAPPSGG